MYQYTSGTRAAKKAEPTTLLKLRARRLQSVSAVVPIIHGMLSTMYLEMTELSHVCPRADTALTHKIMATS